MVGRPKPTRVHLCPHAEEKAKERNIDEQDIKQTLYHPDRVKPAKKKGRSIAERSFSSGAYKIQAVYSIEKDEYGSEFNVVTVMKLKRKGGRR